MLRYGAEMLVKSLLRGFVVIGRHAQDGVRTPQVEFAELVQHLRRRVSAAAHHQRHAACDMVGDEHGDHRAFGHVERRGLGRGAERHDVIHAALYYVVYHARQCLIIDASVRCEGGYHRDPHACQFLSYHRIPVLFVVSFSTAVFRDPALTPLPPPRFLLPLLYFLLPPPRLRLPPCVLAFFRHCVFCLHCCVFNFRRRGVFCSRRCRLFRSRCRFFVPAGTAYPVAPAAKTAPARPHPCAPRPLPHSLPSAFPPHLRRVFRRCRSWR